MPTWATFSPLRRQRGDPGGSLAFTSGGLVVNGLPAGQSIEVLPNGTKVYVQQLSGEFEYRSYFEDPLSRRHPQLTECRRRSSGVDAHPPWDDGRPRRLSGC